jgi:hypothetical protein
MFNFKVDPFCNMDARNRLVVCNNAIDFLFGYLGTRQQSNFPKPGLYRAWGQFQHEGRLLTADFTFKLQDELELVTTILQWQSEVTGWDTWTIISYIISMPATSYRIFRADSVLSEGWIDDK